MPAGKRSLHTSTYQHCISQEEDIAIVPGNGVDMESMRLGKAGEGLRFWGQEGTISTSCPKNPGRLKALGT